MYYLFLWTLLCGINSRTISTSKSNGYKNCGYKETKYHYRLGGINLDEILLATYANPEGANVKTFEENLELCYEKCLENPRCTGIERTPTYYNERKCYLKDGLEFSFTYDWMSRIRILDCDTYCKMGHGQFNMGRDGNILDRFAIPLQKTNQNYGVYVEKCTNACMERDDCTGVQIIQSASGYTSYSTSTTCYLMDGWYVYSSPGTEQISKECIIDRKPKPEPDEYNCELGGVELNRGLDGTIIETVLISSTEVDAGNAEENLELCYKKCLDMDDCGGVQVNPATWTEQKCRLMDGKQSYSRTGWSTRIKSCEKINKFKPRPGFTCEMSNIMTYNFARDGQILSQISLPSSQSEEFEAVLDQCYQNCLNHRHCTGITTSEGDQECYSVNGSTTYWRSGWKIRNKICSKKDV